MSEPRFVFDAIADNFHVLVLANFGKGPVAVNFRSPRAGPCLMLMPRLFKLAEPDNPQAPLDVAKLLVLQGRYVQAEDLLGEADPRTRRYRAALDEIPSRPAE